MAEPTLEELLAYQEERAKAQQAKAAAQPQTSGLLQSILSTLGAAGNPVGQPLAPYDEAQQAIRPRTLMDIIFSRR